MSRRGHVDVHTIDLDIEPAQATALMLLLSQPERERARRFVHERDRWRFIAAHAGLRRILARALGQRPTEVSITAPPHHKPVLRDHPLLHFNLTHAGDVALVATTAHGPVGVDVEPVRAMDDMALVAETVFCDAEREAWRASPAALRDQAFFHGWTRKEALIKATGEGFRADLMALCVALDSDARPKVLASPLSVDEPWQLVHLEPRPGYVGAIAMRCEIPVVLNVCGQDQDAAAAMPTAEMPAH